MTTVKETYGAKILAATKEFFGTQYDSLLAEAVAAYVDGDYTRVDEAIARLPDDIKLLETLVGKLEGKSVHSNIKRLLEGSDQSNEQAIISTSSLITHCAIECKENKEYRRLMPDLYKKLGVLIGKL
jgi:hypothetical protein